MKEADPILRPTAIANNADRLRVPLDNGQRSVDTDSSDPFHDLHHPLADDFETDDFEEFDGSSDVSER